VLLYLVVSMLVGIAYKLWFKRRMASARGRASA
jgi:hypothetical protein